MRPTLRLLDDPLADRIVTEARDVLATLGVEVHHDGVLDLLAGHGAEVDRATRRARLPAALIDRALASVPRAFRLFDGTGEPTHDFSGWNVHFTPGAAAIRILDGATGELRAPLTDDYVRYAKLVSGLPHLAAQSTAFIPSDVPAAVSDSYRLFLSLLYGEKPVITGAFTADAFAVMHDLLLVARGSETALREQPLALFSCCPTSPLQWSESTVSNLVDCARAGIPAEVVAVPFSGFLAPVTLAGTLVQHAAENLSGVVIGQLAAPGAPLLWGCSAAIFDIRTETAPLGAVETMMLACGANEVGRRLGMPTQAYIALSDAKALDAQAGLETGAGAVLAALAGIHSVSGPGMLDLENAQSLEKLVVDHEACGMALRLVQGIEPRDDFPARPLLEELLREKHLLIAAHTRRHLASQIRFPGPVIDRASEARWHEEGSLPLGARATREVERIVASWRPSRLGDDTKRALVRRMEAAGRAAGLPELPVREDG